MSGDRAGVPMKELVGLIGQVHEEGFWIVYPDHPSAERVRLMWKMGVNCAVAPQVGRRARVFTPAEFRRFMEQIEA